MLKNRRIHNEEESSNCRNCYFCCVTGIGDSLGSSSNSDDSTETLAVNNTLNDTVDDTVQNKTDKAESDENAIKAIKEGHYP